MSAQMNLERGLMATVKESLTVQLIASCFPVLTGRGWKGLLRSTIPAKPSDFGHAQIGGLLFLQGDV